MGTLILIICLALIVLAIVILITVICLKVSKSVKNLSNSLYGVDDLIEGIKKQDELYQNTPKSISSMTKIYLPQISKDFPFFSWDDYKRKTESLILAYLNALENKTTINLDYIALSLRDKVEEEITQMLNDGISLDYKNIKIHKTEIIDYTKKDGLCTIKTETSLEYIKCLNGKNDEQKKEQCTYKTELSYIQNEEDLLKTGDSFVANNCRNCGAAVSSLGAKVCDYCGSALVDININTWKFISIYRGK